MTMINGNGGGKFGDTTLTKVFVGGLAWETQKEAMREHFEKYGEILEAVVISDKLTGRSKGYGFVTFKDAGSAKKACEEATPIINGRRANCNLASLGARRPPRVPSTPPPKQGPNVGPRYASPAAPPPKHVQWYFPAAGTPPSPSLFPQHQHAVPYYGYSPTYVSTDISYNHKLCYGGGSYMNGHYSQVYPGQPVVGTTLMPMYHHHPLYHFHQSAPIVGLPAHMYSPGLPSPMSTASTLISKPTSISPGTGCLAVE